MFEKWEACPVCKSQSQWNYDTQVCGLCSNLELELKERAFQMIDRIQEIRSANNEHWMDIMRLGFQHAPELCIEILEKILEKDEQVTAEVRKLVEEWHKTKT